MPKKLKTENLCPGRLWEAIGQSRRGGAALLLSRSAWAIFHLLGGDQKILTDDDRRDGVKRA